jgi:phosphohistidine phosphatase
MILYIIRHAWAGPYGDPAWPDDFQRPLTTEGSLRFAQMVRTLAERDFEPQLVATSPLVRCRQTAQIVARQTAAEPQVVNLDALMPGSDLAAALAWTAAEAPGLEQIAWVGHTPDVGNLTAALLGDSSAWIRFAKGAVAALRFDGPPAPGQGELRWLATAKLLGC